MDSMAAIKQTFFQECEEQLTELEGGLLRIQNGDYDSETINAVFRAVHSIKGGASAFGFDDLVEFVHVFETTLDMLRSNKLSPNAKICDVLLKASDALTELVAAVRNDHSVDTVMVANIKDQLSALCNGASDGDQNAAVQNDSADDVVFEPVSIELDAIFDGDDASLEMNKVYQIKFKPRASLYAKANETTRLFRQLTELGKLKVECHVDDVPFLSELDPEGAYFSWTLLLETQAPASSIDDVFEFVLWDCELHITEADVSDARRIETVSSIDKATLSGGVDVAAQLLSAQPLQTEIRAASVLEAPAAAQDKLAQTSAPQQATIRVDLDKVDRLINLVGELVINQAVLSQRVNEAGLSRASSVMIGLDELEQLTRDIQDSVMAIRAQPVKPIFQRMARVVREVATITRKTVRLVTDGEGAEVDKTVIERLTDPLTHMIRNAVDHGIESPEKRLSVGKPEEGVLRLSAMHRSGRIVIEVSDDGAGIDRARVRQIAVSKGVIPPDASLTDDDVDNLIFAPGFSTVEKASSISGRGVGMDVVKRAIQALGGRISISSRPGIGSTFTMSLPLTLAVLDGMVVTIASQTFVVPLTSIIETLQPKKEFVHVIGRGNRLIRNRDSYIPLIDIAGVLQYRVDHADPTTQVALLVESENGGRCALLVDAIQGQRQVVIKSLESNYGHVRGIAAATILGDGRVALIIDVDAIVNGLRPEWTGAEAASVAAE